MDEKPKKKNQKKTIVEKQNLNDFTKEKLEEDYQKTNKMIDRLQKLIDNVEIEKNANKVKIDELKERIKMLDELKKQVY
jgi:hypothetical protein